MYSVCYISLAVALYCCCCCVLFIYRAAYLMLHMLRRKMKFKSDTVSYMNICWVEKINGLHVYTYKNKNPNQIFAYLKVWVFSFNSFSMFLIYRDILIYFCNCGGILYTFLEDLYISQQIFIKIISYFMWNRTRE